ncbi:hypothetical protein AB1I58_08360 [Enterococcus hirae]|uniref:hypothetical protein n=1 Tax=Enterococcus hirae TaxID=1354 RepID=UPI001A0EF2B2|nr:DUF4145 domain-containing protein [Enterococcus hirae]
MITLKPRYDISQYDLTQNNILTKDVALEIPRICAHCKNTGEQVYINGVELPKKNSANTETLLTTACQFCGEVSLHFFNDEFPGSKHLFSIPPLTSTIDLDTMNISSNIINKFPDFIKILKQAKEAERANLDQLAGMGYRKALEFLVTDFLLEYPQNNISEEWIKNPTTSLSNKIANLPNERIKVLSKAISFIGNDETHYSKRHPEHDVESIKMFLKTLISDIENEIAYQEAEKFLQKPK